MGLDGERRRATWARRRCSATSTSTTFNIDVDAARVARHRAHRRDHRRAPVRALRRTWTRSSSSPQRRGLWVVEDAACALGAWYHGRHAGTLGDAGCFSFHPRKSITTGEGGMVTTDDDELGELARSLRDHGASTRGRRRRRRQDALPALRLHRARLQLPDDRHPGRARLRADGPRSTGSSTRRRELAARYDELLADLDWLAHAARARRLRPRLPGVRLPLPPRGADARERRPASRARNALMRELEQRGIADAPGHARAGPHRLLRAASTASGPSSSRTRTSPTVSRSRCRSTRR